MKPDLIIYDALPEDDQNGIVDRYTVIPDPGHREYLGCSIGGYAASHWGELVPGTDHQCLGRRVTLDELDITTRAHIAHRIKE